jgi:hypothetical protein
MFFLPLPFSSSETSFSYYGTFSHANDLAIAPFLARQTTTNQACPRATYPKPSPPPLPPHLSCYERIHYRALCVHMCECVCGGLPGQGGSSILAQSSVDCRGERTFRAAVPPSPSLRAHSTCKNPHTKINKAITTVAKKEREEERGGFRQL